MVSYNIFDTEFQQI